MADQILRITSLENHCKLLRKVFEKARQRIIIVSPSITDNAIEFDSIQTLIVQAEGRNVSVTIYTDRQLNYDSDGRLKMPAILGIKLLMEAGAKVIMVEGIHNKTLAKDNDMLAEGSFNWLSAVRTKTQHQRHESTLINMGPTAEKMIEEELLSLRNLNSRTLDDDFMNNLIEENYGGFKCSIDHLKISKIKGGQVTDTTPVQEFVMDLTEEIQKDIPKENKSSTRNAIKGMALALGIVAIMFFVVMKMAIVPIILVALFVFGTAIKNDSSNTVSTNHPQFHNNIENEHNYDYVHDIVGDYIHHNPINITKPKND